MKKFTWLLTAAILYLLFSYYLLTIPGKDLPEVGLFNKIPLFDKWVHIGMFTILVYLFALAFRTIIRSHGWVLPLIAGIALSYGIAMEFVQKYWIPNRSFDVTDILADGIGCCIGWWFTRWQMKRNLRPL